MFKEIIKLIKSQLTFLGNLLIWLSRIPFISGSNILNLQKVLNTRIVEKGRKCLNSIYLNFIALILIVNYKEDFTLCLEYIMRVKSELIFKQ